MSQPPSKDQGDRLVTHQDFERIRYITFNRPEKINAMNPALLEQFEEELERAREAVEVRVVVIRGKGRGFSSGNDVNRAQGNEPAPLLTPMADMHNYKKLIERWFRVWDFPKPVIAQVHGYCMGVAMQLVSLCDITIVAEDTKIGWPTIRAGAGILSPMWVHLVGPKRAKEMTFVSGSFIDGATAAQWGWANRAVPADQLEETVAELALKISYTAPHVLELKKLAINRVVEATGFRTAIMGSPLIGAFAHQEPESRERMLTGRSPAGGMNATRQWRSESDAMAAEAMERFRANRP
jgi:enoyl-CoA hydratase